MWDQDLTMTLEFTTNFHGKLTPGEAREHPICSSNLGEEEDRPAFLMPPSYGRRFLRPGKMLGQALSSMA